MSLPVLTRWRRRTSLRLRIVVVTSAAVTAVFAVAGLLNILLVRAEFIHAADAIGDERANRVAELAAQGTLPHRLPVDDEIEAAVQVVRGGQVVSGTANVLHAQAFPLPALPPGRHVVASIDTLPTVQHGPFRTTGVGISTPQGTASVYVAVSTQDIENIVAATVRKGAAELLLLMVPLVALLWVAVGRALAPVEAIRKRAEVITGKDLQQRVPEPDQHDEIGRLARTINAMLGRLHASSERQRQFLGDAAHELRSPIASLRAQIETALDQDGDAQAREVMPDLLADTMRMQALADQLLLLARSDAGMAGRRLAPVDLDDTVDAVIASQRPGDASRAVVVDQSNVAPVQVIGDRALLEQAVRNLVDNAVRYAVSSVVVTLEAAPGEAVLTVDDDGPGIPPEHRQDVFLRFTRLDRSRDRDHGGVGLGLAIVAGVVQDHGGTVVAEASPLGGARLRVTLPLQQE